MQNKQNKQPIDGFLQTSFEKFELQPPVHVFDNVLAEINQKKKTTRKPLFIWFAVAASFLVLLLGFWSFNGFNPNPKPTNVLVEKAVRPKQQQSEQATKATDNNLASNTLNYGANKPNNSKNNEQKDTKKSNNKKQTPASTEQGKKIEPIAPRNGKENGTALLGTISQASVDINNSYNILFLEPRRAQTIETTKTELSLDLIQAPVIVLNASNETANDALTTLEAVKAAFSKNANTAISFLKGEAEKTIFVNNTADSVNNARTLFRLSIGDYAIVSNRKNRN